MRKSRFNLLRLGCPGNLPNLSKLFKRFHTEGTNSVIIHSDFMDSSNRFCVFTTSHQEFRCLVEFESEETETPEEKHYSTHSEEDVTPPRVVCLVADFIQGECGAGKVVDQGPCHQRGD